MVSSVSKSRKLILVIPVGVLISNDIVYPIRVWWFELENIDGIIPGAQA